MVFLLLCIPTTHGGAGEGGFQSMRICLNSFNYLFNKYEVLLFCFFLLNNLKDLGTKIAAKKLIFKKQSLLLQRHSLA